MLSVFESEETEMEVRMEKPHEVTPFERIASHSHITGLGLEGPHKAQGMIGQMKARRAAGLVVDMVREGSWKGQYLLLTGALGTGKAAIAVGMARAMGPDTPVTLLSGSELYSPVMSKTEALRQALRKTITVAITGEEEVIEGEVTDMRRLPEIVEGIAGLIIVRTTDMETYYELGPKLFERFLKLNVTVGDVISLVRNTGQLSKLGRSTIGGRVRDPNVVYMKCPSGEVQKRKTVTFGLTLHDIDVLNSPPHETMEFTGGEISPVVRSQIDGTVLEWRNVHRARLVTGVLFIDEAHMLDEECYAFLNGVLESPDSPVIVLATSDGIHGTSFTQPFGIPKEQLDRVLVVRTDRFALHEIGRILAMRCIEERCIIEHDALWVLARIAAGTCLRYGVQLLIAASIVASRHQRNAITIRDLSRMYGLFLDEHRSSRILKENIEERKSTALAVIPEEPECSGLDDDRE